MKLELLILMFGALFLYCAAEFHCEMGTPYKENNCNTCNCLGGRLLGCTEMACLNANYKELFNCTEGAVTKNGCNTCTCVKGLGTICTDRDC